MPGLTIPKFICTIFLLFLVTNVAAGISGVPAYIAVREDPADFSFELSNETDFTAALDVELFAPTDYEIVEMPGWVDAGETASVTIRLQPESGLAGSSYKSLLIVKLGTEETEKNISINFAESVQPAEDKEDAAEDKEYATDVQKGSPGFAGLASLFDSDGLPTGNAFELVVNIMLIFIAAFLLIAFISRLVKRLLNAQPQHARQAEYNPNAQAKQTEFKTSKAGGKKYEPYNPALEELKNKINTKMDGGGFK